MNLDKFSISKKVFGIINSVNRDDEQDMLICAVMRLIYDHDESYGLMLQNARAVRAFESIRALIDKDLRRARKAKARREDRKAHPEKYPPRQRGNTRKAGALELPSGHVVESDHAEFDYYCVKNNKILYFRMIGAGEIDGDKASFEATYKPEDVINSIIAQVNRGAVPQGTDEPWSFRRNTYLRPSLSLQFSQ